MELFAASIHGWLQALHGLLGFALFVSVTMADIFAYLVGQSNWKHVSIAGAVASLTYLATFAVGWLIYPVFRVDVRAEFLDQSNPVSTGLFELKEHISAIGAFVAIALLMLSLFGRMQTAPSSRRQLYGGLLAVLSLTTYVVFVLVFTRDVV